MFLNRIDRIPRWVLLLPLLGALVSTGEVHGQRWGAEVRAGVVASTPLVEDAMATSNRLALVGLPDHIVDPLTVAAAPAPTAVAALSVVVQPDLALELSGGWAAGALVAKTDGIGTRRIRNVGIGQALMSVRRNVGDRLHARVGVGGIRYDGGGEGIFRDGPELRGLTEAAAGGQWPVGSGRLTVDMAGQLHGFGTPALRAEGGVDGRVYRLVVTAGYRIGGTAP